MATQRSDDSGDNFEFRIDDETWTLSAARDAGPAGAPLIVAFDLTKLTNGQLAALDEFLDATRKALLVVGVGATYPPRPRRPAKSPAKKPPQPRKTPAKTPR